jgi:hypothetical protein
METIHRRNCHDLVAFRCPLSHCVEINGMSFSPLGWHPLVAAASEHAASGIGRYEGSCLERYYAAWQPRNAREALIGASAGPARLDDFPAWTRHTPWSQQTFEESAAFMARIIEIENTAFGGAQLSPSDGYVLHGPVSTRKGRLEYARLADLVDSMREAGFDRSRGDLTVEVLHRNGQFRFLIVHGHHRAAAAAALGHDVVPAIPVGLVDVRDAPHWPGVYRGLWTQAEALAYVEHLFTFDSMRWALDRGLPPQRSPAVP